MSQIQIAGELLLEKDAELHRLRTELATKDARIAELEACAIFEMHAREFVRAERAESEAKALQEALELAMVEIDKHQAATGDTLRGNPRNHVSFPPTLDKIRAALNPSPADPE